MTGTVASHLSDIVVQWAKEGYGIVMVSIWDVAESLRAGELVRVPPDYRQSADVWAMTAERLSSSARIQECIEFLREQLTHGPCALVTRGVGGL
ncbi:DNA-binding transcriptional LysR family regulator [Paraburkholderia sp. UCT70]